MPIQYVERRLVRLGLSPGCKSFSKASQGQGWGILVTHMTSLVISIGPDAEDTLSICMLDYVMNMQRIHM